MTDGAGIYQASAFSLDGLAKQLFEQADAAEREGSNAVILSIEGLRHHAELHATNGRLIALLERQAEDARNVSKYLLAILVGAAAVTLIAVFL